jgi:anti-sigma factor RsiW
MTVAPMNCQQLVELVTEYFENALPAPERIRVENHLQGCGACRAHLEQMRITLNLVGKLTADDLSDPARDELMSVFRQWKNEQE